MLNHVTTENGESRGKLKLEKQKQDNKRDCFWSYCVSRGRTFATAAPTQNGRLLIIYTNPGIGFCDLTISNIYLFSQWQHTTLRGRTGTGLNKITYR